MACSALANDDIYTQQNLHKCQMRDDGQLQAMGHIYIYINAVQSTMRSSNHLILGRIAEWIHGCISTSRVVVEEWAPRVLASSSIVLINSLPYVYTRTIRIRWEQCVADIPNTLFSELYYTNCRPNELKDTTSGRENNKRSVMCDHVCFDAGQTRKQRTLF